jgi:hypothetical protein
MELFSGNNFRLDLIGNALLYETSREACSEGSSSKQRDSTILLLHRSLNQTAKPAQVDGNCEIPVGNRSKRLHLRLVKNTDTGFMKCVKGV